MPSYTPNYTGWIMAPTAPLPTLPRSSRPASSSDGAGYMLAPIVQQLPTVATSAALPERPASAGGLHALALAQQLNITRCSDIVCAYSAHEISHTYVITNERQQEIYYGVWQGGHWCVRHGCVGTCPYELKVYDHLHTPILLVQQPLSWCGACCCLASRQALLVQTGGGNTIGHIERHCWAWRWCRGYRLSDARDQTLLRLRGACCAWRRDTEYAIMSQTTGQRIGSVARLHRNGTAPHCCQISWPRALQIEPKLLLLAAGCRILISDWK